MNPKDYKTLEPSKTGQLHDIANCSVIYIKSLNYITSEWITQFPSCSEKLKKQIGNSSSHNSGTRPPAQPKLHSSINGRFLSIISWVRGKVEHALTAMKRHSASTSFRFRFQPPNCWVLCVQHKTYSYLALVCLPQGAGGRIVGWGTMLQAGRSRVRFCKTYLRFIPQSTVHAQ
jgi:hypothetical protein